MVKRAVCSHPAETQEVHQEVWKPAKAGFGLKELEQKEVEEESFGAQGVDIFPWFTGFIDHRITQWFDLVWKGP